MKKKHVYAEMVFEFAVPAAFIVNSMSSKLFMSIDFLELSASQHHSECIIQDHADFDPSAIPFMPIDMSCGSYIAC